MLNKLVVGLYNITVIGFIRKSLKLTSFLSCELNFFLCFRLFNGRYNDFLDKKCPAIFFESSPHDLY